MSDIFGSGGGSSPKLEMMLCENTYNVWVSGSYDPPGQLAPPMAPGAPIVDSGPSALLTTGGVNSGPILYFESSFTASARSSGVKSIKSSTAMPCRSNAGGFVGNGCVGEYHSPGTSPFSTGRSSIGHTGSPVTRSDRKSVV